MKHIDAFKRDNLLVGIIFQHKGKENAIGTQELASALNEGGTRRDTNIYIIWLIGWCMKGICLYVRWVIAVIIGQHPNKTYNLPLMNCKVKFRDYKNALIY